LTEVKSKPKGKWSKVLGKSPQPLPYRQAGPKGELFKVFKPNRFLKPVRFDMIFLNLLFT
jgi:hypothetical protein